MISEISEFQRVRTLAEGFENFLVDEVSSVAPWLAPIPSAYLVARATIVYLAWGQLLAVVAALIIESLGLSTASTALALRNYNNSRRKADEPAPFGLAACLFVCYLVITVGFTGIFELDPALAKLAPPLFPLLALMGSVNLALRADHKRRLQMIADERVERKAKRHAGRQPSVKQANEPVSGNLSNNDESDAFVDRMQTGRKAKVDSRILQMLDILKLHPGMSKTDIARSIDVSRKTVYSYLDDLEKAGRVRNNGHGLEVLDG